MAIVFTAGRISGSVKAPPSKSVMQRVLVASLLSEGTSMITNPSYCDDCVAAAGMISTLGAEVRQEEGRLVVRGGLDPAGSVLDCGESGLALRMFSPVAAMTGKQMVLTGRGSLVSRPAGMIEQPLRALGAEVETNNGFLPVCVRGPLRGGKAEVDGSVSSQFLTGLLFALPLAPEDSVIMLRNATSRPYIDMTIEILSKYDIRVENRNYEEFYIGGRQRYNACETEIEGDWSGAAFFMVMAALSGEISIEGLRSGSKQADRRIIDALKLAGAGISFHKDTIKVAGSSLRPFTFDISDCPDLAPPLSVLAAGCPGKSTIVGTSRLNVKESSRGENLKTNLEKLGAVTAIYDDKMEIEGTGRLKFAKVSSFGDHRMAMAMAAASVLSPEGVAVDDTGCINKSYPGFLNDFIRSGGNIITG